MLKVPKLSGDEIWKKQEKIDAELFILTYGSLVAQLVKDLEEPALVNRQLEKMGYNIGQRLIDDYLARAVGSGKCENFRDTAEQLSKVGFKIYLGISPTLASFSPDGKEFSLILDENPLAEFVEIPESLIGTGTGAGGEKGEGLWFSNILCGVIRGALEMIHIQVSCQFLQDTLRGDPVTELRVRLVKYLDEEVPISDD